MMIDNGTGLEELLVLLIEIIQVTSTLSNSISALLMLHIIYTVIFLIIMLKLLMNMSKIYLALFITMIKNQFLKHSSKLLPSPEQEMKETVNILMIDCYNVN
jgi:hypothetical protein